MTPPKIVTVIKSALIVITLLLSFQQTQALQLSPKNLGDPETGTSEVREFITSLQNQKNWILGYYPYVKWQVSELDYDILAHMALGILGQESKYFTSRRYWVKENLPWAITVAKKSKAFFEQQERITPNSRGGTQIKNIPDIIEQNYHLTPDDLHEPRNAAVATMGFLIESLHQLRNQAKNRGREEFTYPEIINYLPYIYFGASRRIFDGTATPDKNLYVINMKVQMRRFYMKSDSQIESLPAVLP